MASWIEQRDGEFINSRMNWINLLKTMGYEFKFVASDDIENRVLQRDGYCFLILPVSLGLSDRECAAINEFAAAGGGVIADLQPGIRNHRGAPADPQRLQAALSSPRSLWINDQLSNNLQLDKMQNLRRELETRFRGQHLSNGSEYLSIQKGAPSITRFNLDSSGGELIGLWNDKAGQIKMTPPQGTCLYDVLEKKELAGGIIDLPISRPKLFALLPYRVQDVQVNLQALPGGFRVAAAVVPSRGKALRHVFRYMLFPPGQEKESQIYSRVVEGPGGVASYEVYPALNETGEWRVAVEDVISGSKKTVKFQFQKDVLMVKSGD